MKRLYVVVLFLFLACEPDMGINIDDLELPRDIYIYKDLGDDSLIDDSTSAYEFFFPEFEDTEYPSCDYYEAQDICELKGFRLPKLAELNLLVQGCPRQICDPYDGPGINGCYWDPGIEKPCRAYWSSTRKAENSLQVYRLNFVSADILAVHIRSRSHVVCVREKERTVDGYEL